MQTLKRKDVQIKLRLASSEVATVKWKGGYVKDAAEQPHEHLYSQTHNRYGSI